MDPAAAVREVVTTIRSAVRLIAASVLTGLVAAVFAVAFHLVLAKGLSVLPDR